MQSFRAGKIWVLICSALLARGMDFKGVNMVINYDLPTSAVEYIHRIGEAWLTNHLLFPISEVFNVDAHFCQCSVNLIEMFET